MGEIVVNVDYDLLQISLKSSICRICHEEEDLEIKCNNLEAPCACSGTLKFAHRDCIQRWCYEKGNTKCEICLQNYEPGYIAPPTKSQLIDAVVTIRGSLTVPRRERTLVNNHEECSSPTSHGANCCRMLALIFTVVLLVKHLVFEVVGEKEEYPFPLVALLLIRATGILIPMCIMIRIISEIQKIIINHRLQYQGSDGETNLERDDEDENFP